MAASAGLRLSTNEEIDGAYARAKEVFATGMTKDRAWRHETLHAVRRMLQEDRELIEEAITADMGRCKFEAKIFETDALLAHVNEAISILDEATASEHHAVPLALGTASARVDVVPKGAVLIIGAWNYPAQLTIGPLIDAIAAGNTVVVKPSEVSERSAAVLQGMLEKHLGSRGVFVVQADKDGTTRLLEKRWDHIVYTGNAFVGRIVMAAAAKHLTPVTLELGGKCPAFVDGSADLTVACRRIAQARFANAGQTCLAVDYCLVTADVHDAFVAQMVATVQRAYGTEPRSSGDFARVINARHTKRIGGVIDDARDKGANIVLGGDWDEDECYVAPTIVTDCPDTAKLQREETFGPVLLVQRVATVEEGIERVNSGEKPLALYIFSSNSSVIDKVQRETLSGAVAVNDALVQKGVVSAPFGGVGESGLGAYGGKRGVQELSHHRPVFTNPTAMDVPLRYPPYTDFGLRFIGSLVGLSRSPLTWRSAIPVGIIVLLAALYSQGYFDNGRIQRIVDAFKW